MLAVLIRYEIEDIERFISPAKLCSYSGLVPSTYSTGGKTYQGRITKHGNRWLRWTQTEAAQKAVMNDLWLKGLYRRIAERRGKKKAKINEKTDYYRRWFSWMRSCMAGRNKRH